MKITTNAEDFSNLLDLIVRAAKQRSALPILGSVLIDADKDKGSLKVAATDTEISISVTAAAPVQESGKSAVRAGVLHNISKSLSADTATLTCDSSTATLEAKQGTYTINAYRVQDFPTLPAFPRGEKDGETFTVPAKALAAGIEKVLPFVSKDDTRPVLTGALVSFEGGALTMVATDSYRMGITRVPLEYGPEEKVQKIIPARALKEVARLAELTETIKIALTENAAMFGAQGVLISSRLIDGNFPEFERLLPEKFERTFSVGRLALLSSLRRVAIFCGNDTPPKPVSLSFTSGEGSLTGAELVMRASSEGMGTAHETVPLSGDGKAGEGFTAAFNPAYLTSAVAAAGSENVTMKFNGPLNPAMLFPGDSSGDSSDGEPATRIMLMPMRDPDADADKPAAKRKAKAAAPKPAAGEPETEDGETGKSGSAGTEAGAEAEAEPVTV